MNILKSVVEWFVSLFHRDNNSFKVLIVEDIPDRHREGVIYIVGEDSPWYAIMMCPCGCNEIIRLCLQNEVSPSWKLKYHDNGTVSLYPSVWRTNGCKSHFFLRYGRVDWCQ